MGSKIEADFLAMPDFAGPYVIEFGDVWRQLQGATTNFGRDHVADGTEQLGVAYDSETGQLLKHGNATLVERWLTDRRSKLIASGFDDMASNYQAVYFPISPETVDELNACIACIACSGRVLQIIDRLQVIGQESPEIANRPVYPPR